MIGEKVLVKTPFGVLEGTVVREEKSRKYGSIYVVKTKKGFLYALSKEIKRRKNYEMERYSSSNKSPKQLSNACL